MKLKAKFIVALTIASSILMACQKGKQVGSQTNIYADNLQICNSISEELMKQGINLNSKKIAQGIERKNTEYPHLSRDQKADLDIRANLERFVVAAEKISQMADERVVVFPDKIKIQRELKIASYYLGEIYSDIYWTDTSVSISKQVDYVEADYRFRRVSKNLNIIKKAGLPYGGDSAQKMPNLKKFKTTELRQLQGICEQVQTDFARINVLTTRNDGWGNEGFRRLGGSAQGITGYYYILARVLTVELSERGSLR